MGSDSECIRHAIEERKQRRDVHGLGYLWLSPPVIAKRLHIFRSRAIRSFGYPGDIVKQSVLRGTETCPFEVAPGNGLYCSFFGSLNPQEVCMRVQSIRTAIEPGNPAGNRFFGSSREMALGEMNGIAEPHDVPKKVWTVTKALQDPWDLLATRFDAPLVIDLSHFACGLGILDEFDFGIVLSHSSRFSTLA